MSRKEIEDRIQMLKVDYIRVQGDIEKLESVGRGVEKAESQLTEIEQELTDLNHKLTALI
ncbi:SE1832 family protein [Thalassorhabdus alkalitolerans]|uniref:SE1832 family protein n=1 Tax=Thalassorhabdus alkalitolerans TaxID=2282697 RepID=A0ABW0YM05_9BACI|nr:MULTISPECIES: SE1832 family protein [Bacillaceae]